MTEEEKMRDDEPASVPYTVFEAEMARAERRDQRHTVIIIILIFLLVISNLAWIIYEAQYVDESVVQEIDTGDGDAVVAGIGDIHYGEGEADG